MTDFDTVVNYILLREGELKEADIADPGGITKYGISLRFLRELSSETLKKYGIFEPITEQTIRDLTLDQAKAIYRNEFWDCANFGQIYDELICCYLFDMVVNMGLGQSIKIAQRAVGIALFSRNILREDGILGEKTLNQLNSITSDILMPILVALRIGFYQQLVLIDSRKEANLNGWLNRCYNIFT